MRHPLVAKELRDQRPFLWLALFFIAVEVISTLWTEPLGFAPYASTFVERFKAGGDLSILTSIFTFALGSGLMVREQDDRTLEFLDALPTSRLQLFGVKVLVALGTVLVYPLGVSLWLLGAHVLSRTSLDPGLHLDMLAVGTVLRVAQAFTVLALALALAPLRRLGWTALAVLMLAQSLLQERVPWLSALNPLRLTEPEFEGTRWRWPLEALGLQLSVACVLMALALAQFLGLGERLAGAMQRRLQGSWMGTLATLATIGMFFAVLVQVFENEGEEAKEDVGGSSKVEFPSMTSAQADTGHYRFTYPSHLSRRAQPLLQDADSVFEEVRTFLGVEAGAPIQADLGGSARHTAGTAYWNTLRLNLAGLDDASGARDVLRHETTHVLAQRITGVEAAPRLSAMRLLSEGLATYVEHRFGANAEELEAYEVIAAAARARREVKTEELLDLDRLAAERDENWVYPLGRAFIEVLVRRHGDGAPARVLAALGRKDAPEGLEGALAWQDAFQTAGIDLSRVFDDFFAYLDEQALRHASVIDSLPRPRGAVERKDERVGIRAVVDGPIPEGWRVVCRFRPEETSEPHEVDGPYSGPGPHWREPSELSEGNLWYQLGLQGPHGFVLYEPWTLVRAR
ncbi:ABC transporter permease subunit [Pyxidicoccus fallax]|uniref:ABC transporter permease subunit n=1 Tax=Pyxidicoccus fallax TaxID=394095 RepID=A0A848LFY6_9BACT|nr:ABC transporter permease [Pyxidicoccus fallax]NMO14598.1 ABC transporter permease subunit [Pyxidicoccus fallax]NPC77362.1 ABC transporter permease subunit [Pyxidicoccus fallax]